MQRGSLVTSADEVRELQTECAANLRCNQQLDLVASVAARSSKIVIDKDNTNALDNLRYLTDSMVAGNGHFHHARWLYPFIADHRHRRGIDQTHSGTTTTLRLPLAGLISGRAV